jgi:hypothetical protein
MSHLSEIGQSRHLPFSTAILRHLEAAQPAHPADAAARRQDRDLFGFSMRSNVILLYRWRRG